MSLNEALQRRGWTSDALAIRSHGENGHEVEALGQGWRDIGVLRRFRRRARAYDIVVAHGSDTLWVAAMTLPGVAPFVYVNIGDPLFWTPTWRKRLRVAALLSRARAVAAISDRASRVLVEHLWVSEARVTVIPNARDARLFTPPSSEDRTAARDRLGLPSQADVALYLGALSAEKRPDVAVRAAANVPGLHLVVAGDGPEREAVLASGAELMPGRLHVLGRVERPEHVLMAADVLLLTSDSEGVPGVLIEAGMCGLPAVATRVGYVADVVQDGVTGRLCGAGDVSATSAALTEALRHRLEWGAAAREWCTSQFDFETVLDAWVQLLDSLVSVNPSTSRQQRRAAEER